MSAVPLRLLMLEDRAADAELVLRELRRAGYDPVGPRVESEGDFLAHLEADWDLILSDFGLPQFDALRALQHVTARNLDIPFIMISGTVGEDVAVTAIQQGAADYLLKDRLGRLGEAVRRAIEQRRMRHNEAAATASLRQSMASLAEAQRLAHIGSWDWDIAADRLTWSDEHFRIFGAEPGAFTPSYEAFLARVHADDRPRVEAAVLQTLQRHHRLELECGIVRENGSEGIIHSRAVVIRDEDGHPVRMVGTAQDVTERTRAERARQAAEAKYRALIEQIPAVVYTDRRVGTSQTYFVSPQIEAMLGYTPEEYLADGELWARSLHDDDRARVFAEVERSTSTGEPLRAEYRLRARDGRVVWVRDEAMPVADPSGGAPIWQGVLLDISERKALEGQLRHQAFHDALTGLPNRALVLDRLEHARARASRLGSTIAVLFLDLDNFKVINDGLGHAAGDELLVGVARRLWLAVRDGDTVARLGGDEFVCVLEDLDGVPEAEAIAGRVADRLTAPVVISGHEVVVSASIGIAVGSSSILEEPEVLLGNADQAMYAAKRAGKARAVTFDPIMNARAWNRLELESDLRRAIDEGDLFLVYQPIVDLGTGSVPEVEALVRWRHPLRGIVQPSDFVAVAEESDLIFRLGRRVLDEACLHAMTWAGAVGGPPVVAVNLSARQFADPDLVGDVAAILSRTGLPPARLRLEITERVALADDTPTTQTLAALHALGVGLAIDDFGTGYSGLGTLKGSLVDTLKIDRSFVAGLGGDDRDTAIVRAVLALAGALGMVTVAEGVETDGQVAALRSLGCDRGQGFLFARPMAHDDLARYLHAPSGAVPELQLVR